MENSSMIVFFVKKQSNVCECSEVVRYILNESKWDIDPGALYNEAIRSASNHGYTETIKVLLSFLIITFCACPKSLTVNFSFLFFTFD